MIATTGGSPIVTIIVSSVAGLWVASGLVYRRRVRRSGSLLGNSAADGVDPGWRPVFFRMMRMWPQPGPADSPDPLTTMRMILLGLEIAPVLMLLVLSFKTPWSNASAGPAPWIVVEPGFCP